MSNRQVTPNLPTSLQNERDIAFVFEKLSELIQDGYQVSLTLQIQSQGPQNGHSSAVIEPGWIKWSKDEEDTLKSLVEKGVSRRHILKEFKMAVGETQRTDASILAKYGNFKLRMKNN